MNFIIPANACNSHMHIYDSRFALGENEPGFFANATVTDYRKVQDKIGTQRTVIVTPRLYITDNDVTLDAIARLGIENARGVAVIRPDVTDEELKRLHKGGIRGVRFTLYTLQNAVVSFDMVEPLANRIHELGWHLQLHWTAEQIVEYEAMLQRLPCKIVFDHMVRLPLPQGLQHPAYNIVRKLTDSGKVWVKLSGPYLDSQVGLDANYADMTAIANHWAKILPERTVWGSDWPHTTETHKPDDAMLMSLLESWVNDEKARHRILVDNPAELYEFTV